MGSFFKDRFLIGCTTAVVLGVIAGLLLLLLNGDRTDVYKIISFIGPAFTGVVVLFGVGHRVTQQLGQAQQATTAAQSADQHAQDTLAATQQTTAVIGKALNGALTDKLTTAVRSVAAALGAPDPQDPVASDSPAITATESSGGATEPSVIADPPGSDATATTPPVTSGPDIGDIYGGAVPDMTEDVTGTDMTGTDT